MTGVGPAVRTLGCLRAGQRGGPPAAECPAGGPGQGDDHRERHAEQGQGEEGHHRDDDEGAAVQRPLGDADDGLHHDRQHRSGEPGEQRGDDGRRAERDVDRGEREQRHHAREHEEPAGDQPAARAVQQPPDVRGQLLRLGAGQERAVVQGVQEAALADPSLVVDQSPLHDGDLAGRPAERLQRDREPGPHGRPERDRRVGGRVLPHGVTGHASSSDDVAAAWRAGISGKDHPRRRGRAASPVACW